ncbi:MAG: outer membrane beta-barrel family protein [Anditalea sp.]
MKNFYHPFYLSIKAFLLLALFSFAWVEVSAQSGRNANVKGKIVDSSSSLPLSFASVAIYESQEKKLIDGNITDEEGVFSIDLPFGSYYALIEFMGYDALETATFELSREDRSHDLGAIKIEPSTANLEEVVVQGQKNRMELSLDKRIFNVGQDLANAGGSASDVLMNLPSVSVDPEGNVRLRGSDNVRILIDGKPSGLVSFKGSSGLQQLPASMIETVEVITNPSARYEAEGMAGVINIVLKKENNQGFNGSFEVIAGDPTNLGLSANLNYRRNKINWFINYGVAHRKLPNRGSLYQEVYGEDTTFILRQANKGVVTSLNNNVRAGLDYYFNEKSILTGSYLLRRSDAHRILDIRYEDYLFTDNNLEGYSTRRQVEDEKEPHSEANLSYKRSFEQKGHEFTAGITYLDYWENSEQVYTQSFFQPDGTEEPAKSVVQMALNDEFERQWLFQVDYTKPIGEEGNFETGLRSSFRNMENDFVVSEQNETGDFIPFRGMEDIFLYQENIHAIYGILGNKSNKFSYQGGLRAELTDVTTTLVKANEINPRDYINFFPSAHLTYSFTPENAFQLSYSRRVRRPFYNDLSPFVTFSDARNFFSGNPDLEPEFTNAYEMGHIKYFEKGSLFSTLYYRSTTDKIDRIRSVDEEGNSRTITQNLISEKSMGAEFTSDYSVNDWWNMDLNVNFFYADIDGSNILEAYKVNTYSWFARYSSRFNFSNGMEVQLRSNYEARQKTAQGVRKSLFYADLSASKDVFKGRGTLILNIMDVLNSRRNRYISEGPGFYTVGDSQRTVRQVNLTLNYRIKQAKQAPKSDILGE